MALNTGSFSQASGSRLRAHKHRWLKVISEPKNSGNPKNNYKMFEGLFCWWNPLLLVYYCFAMVRSRMIPCVFCWRDIKLCFKCHWKNIDSTFLCYVIAVENFSQFFWHASQLIPNELLQKWFAEIPTEISPFPPPSDFGVKTAPEIISFAMITICMATFLLYATMTNNSRMLKTYCILFLAETCILFIHGASTQGTNFLLAISFRGFLQLVVVFYHSNKLDVSQRGYHRVPTEQVV